VLEKPYKISGHCLMTALLTLMAILVGAVLGTRYKVFILIPAAMAACFAALGIGAIRTETLSIIFGNAVAATVSLQVGYFAAAVLLQIRNSKLSGKKPARVAQRSAL